MTLKEQYIYNCYLETSRKVNLQPFRYRKDFEGFEEKEEYVYIAKLGYFFNKFPNINIKDFFEAPFYVYNEKYFDGLYPYIFKPKKGHKTIYLNIINIKKITYCASIKNEKSNVNRVIDGIMDTHTFFSTNFYLFQP